MNSMITLSLGIWLMELRNAISKNMPCRVISLNIAESENESVVIAKTCGCKNTNRRVTYVFVDQTHGLCMDKKDVIQAEIGACEKLSSYAIDESDKIAIRKEISELRMAMDLLT